MDTISYFSLPGTTRFGIMTDSKIKRIQELVFQQTGETLQSIKIRSRMRNRVLTRNMIFYFLRRYTKLALKEINPLYNLQDHSTVLYGIKSLRDLMDTEPELKKQVEFIDNVLKEDLRHLQ